MSIRIMADSLMKIYLLMTSLIGCRCLHYKMQSEEEALLNHMFTDYNPSARPVLNSSHTVTVNINFKLFQIQDLNVRSQVLTTTGVLILQWKDERLRWRRGIDSDLDQIVVSGENIWKPEFAIINGAESILQDFSEFQAILYPSGLVRWEPGGIFKTMCQIDITYYPFDEQKCELVFGAWSYYTSKMDLTTKSVKINIESYEKNGEWTVLQTHAERREFFFECCPDQRFSNIKFTVFLRRRHTFYIMNVILPGILTSCVLLSIFFCTPAQKVHIGVAALLSFRLFLLNVADTIPRTSDHVPLLGVYLTCTMAITTLAMVATVFVLNLYGTREKPVPRWAYKLFTVYLARVMCMCNCVPKPGSASSDEESDLPSPEHDYSNNDRRKSSFPLFANRRKSTAPSISSLDLPKTDMNNRRASHASLLTPPGSANSEGHPLNHRRLTCIEVPASPSRSPLPSPKSFPGAISRQASRAEPKKAPKEDYTKDWVHVAIVFDRLFFWLCLCFILVTTLMLFHPLTTSKYFKIPLVEKDVPT